MPFITPDHAVVRALYRAMKPVADHSQSVEVVAACVAMIGALLAHNSGDLPQALGNVDRIAADLKKFLNRKMGN